MGFDLKIKEWCGKSRTPAFQNRNFQLEPVYYHNQDIFRAQNSAVMLSVVLNCKPEISEIIRIYWTYVKWPESSDHSTPRGHVKPTI